MLDHFSNVVSFMYSLLQQHDKITNWHFSIQNTYFSHRKPAVPILYHFPFGRYRSSFIAISQAGVSVAITRVNPTPIYFIEMSLKIEINYFSWKNPAVAEIRTTDLPCCDIALQTTQPPRLAASLQSPIEVTLILIKLCVTLIRSRCVCMPHGYNLLSKSFSSSKREQCHLSHFVKVNSVKNIGVKPLNLNKRKL